MIDMVFYHISKDIPEYAQYFITSVQENMPNTVIWQLTDRTTPAIPGVDIIKRFDAKFPLTRNTINYLGYQFLVESNMEQVIFVDPDMIINGNIEPLMKGNFDVTVATRCIGDPVPVEHHIEFPWCSFMVVKNKQFWKDCFDYMLGYDESDWMDNMAAVKAVIKSGKYRVKVLNGDIYNQHPLFYDPDVMVYHCKGEDKTPMKTIMLHKEAYNERRNQTNSILLQGQTEDLQYHRQHYGNI